MERCRAPHRTKSENQLTNEEENGTHTQKKYSEKNGKTRKKTKEELNLKGKKCSSLFEVWFLQLPVPYIRLNAGVKMEYANME